MTRTSYHMLGPWSLALATLVPTIANAGPPASCLGSGPCRSQPQCNGHSHCNNRGCRLNMFRRFHRRANCDCDECRRRDPCRHHSPFVREMSCTCRDYVPPAGTQLYRMMRNQINNGTASRLVLYHYDFLPRDARLNRRGLRQLDKIARMMATTTAPLIIQPTPGRPELDKLRKKLVATRAATLPVPIPTERIVIAPRPVHGFDGIDAEIVHGKLLKLMQSGGGTGGAGASGASGGSGLGQAPTR